MKRLVLIIIAIACCTMQYNETMQACYHNSFSQFVPKVKSFCSLNYGWTWFQSKDGPGSTMKSRILPDMLSSVATHDLCTTINGKQKCEFDKLAARMSWWNALWMLAAMIVVIFTFDSLLWTLGIFTGCMWAYMPLAMYNIYSYDGPILFFWVLMVIFATCKTKRKWFLPALLAAMLCKETALVCCIVPFMWTDLLTKLRIRKALIFLACGVALKVIVDLIVQNPIPFFSMTTCAGSVHPACWIENMHKIAAHTLDTPWLAAAGMGIGLLFLPNNPETLIWKIIAIVFTCGIMVCGISTEYRIFQELIPVFIYCYGSTYLMKDAKCKLNR